MYVCVSEYVHDWRIHSSNVNENIYCYIFMSHNVLVYPPVQAIHIATLTVHSFNLIIFVHFISLQVNEELHSLV